jgi:hypothetical protein
MSQNTKHTPGPWRIWRDMDPKEPVQIIGMETDFVCTIDGTNTNADGNALLISMAPTLEARLQAALKSDAFHTEACGAHQHHIDELTEALRDSNDARHKLDVEIGEFQNEVRELIIERSGAPENCIDGKGSDAGWQEFTLAEIGQGFAYLVEQRDALLAACKAACAAAADCLPPTGERPLDPLYYKAKLMAIDAAAAQCSAAIAKAGGAL